MVLLLLVAVMFVGLFSLLHSLPLCGVVFGLVWVAYGAVLMFVLLLMVSYGPAFFLAGGK